MLEIFDRCGRQVRSARVVGADPDGAWLVALRPVFVADCVFSGVGNQPYGGCGLPDRYGRALLFSVKLKFYRLFKSFTDFLPSYE